MKKLTAIISICLLAYTAAQAYPKEETVERYLRRAAVEQVGSSARSQYLLSAVKASDLSLVKQMLSAENEDSVYLGADIYGNNILHVASPQIFAVLWAHMPAPVRERLLVQANHIGETPLMSQISYGHEDLFLYYFPKTKLYERLTRTTSDLAAGGVMGEIARIKQAGLLEECSAAGQTMWQRADNLYRSAAGTSREKMKQVRDQIGYAAPFLVR